MNAISINPSSPINFAKGFKKFENSTNILSPFIFMFANNHVIAPAGAAIITALDSTNIVLSIIDEYKTLPIFGIL